MSWKRRVIFAAVLVAVIWKFRLRWKMISRKDRVGKSGCRWRLARCGPCILALTRFPGGNTTSTTVWLLATVPYLLSGQSLAYG